MLAGQTTTKPKETNPCAKRASVQNCLSEIFLSMMSLNSLYFPPFFAVLQFRSRDTAEVLCRRRLEIHRFHRTPGVRKSPTLLTTTYFKNQRNQRKLITPPSVTKRPLPISQAISGG